MKRHELKILPKWYVDVESSKKNFEIRRNDRDFKVGDTLILQEYEEGSYTGRQITRKIQYIYQGNGDYGLSEGYCIMGLEQEPKTVLYSGDGYADGYMVYDMAECPNCGYEYEEGDKDWEEPYCCHCGQKLKWFDNTESEG